MYKLCINNLVYINCLYDVYNISHRVCSAACQILEDSGALWQGARLHLSANIDSLQAGICSSEEDNPRACARANVRFITHSLLNSAFFKRAESVLFGYTFTIRMCVFDLYSFLYEITFFCLFLCLLLF